MLSVQTVSWIVQILGSSCGLINNLISSMETQLKRPSTLNFKSNSIPEDSSSALISNQQHSSLLYSYYFLLAFRYGIDYTVSKGSFSLQENNQDGETLNVAKVNHHQYRLWAICWRIWKCSWIIERLHGCWKITGIQTSKEVKRIDW